MTPTYSRRPLDDMLSGRRFFVSAIFFALAFSAAPSRAQTYPAKPVRVIVAQVAAGASDILVRVLAKKLSDALGQQFVIDNRPGAGGNIGAEMAARSTPDGYTLFMVSAPHAVAPSLYKKLPYDLMRDFAPIASIASEQLCLVVHPSLPAKSIREFVAFLKNRPRQVTYASTGNGAVNHLATELFKSMARVDMVHVPYKGTTFAIPDVINDRVPVLFANLSPLLPHIESHRLRALAVTGKSRSPALPDVPTIAESGYPGYETLNWFGIVAPARTPNDIVQKLNGAIAGALNLPDVRQQYAKGGVEPMTMTPEEMKAFLRSEIEKWAEVVRVSGARID